MPNRVKQILDNFDFGETFYLVDGDYRTPAQGWSTSDATGPLDLYMQANPGYVFYTPGGATGPSTPYSTDSAAIQAAIDAQVDFRGDVLYFTPGAYLPTTALVLNVPDSRWMGSRRRRGQSATITATLTNQFGPTGAADSMEFAHLRFVPLTAGILFGRATAGCDNWWMHDFTYDARGITASTGTIFMKDTGACLNTTIEDFTYLSNTAIGPLVQIAAASITGRVQRFWHCHTANTLVTSLYETISGGAGASGWTIGPGHVQIGAGGVITQWGAQIDMTAAGTNATMLDITASVAGATAALGWEAATGVAGEGDLVRCTVALIAGGSATVGAGGGSAVFGTT